MAPTIMFAGPTMARAQRIAPDLSLDGIDLRGPVKRGDVPTIMKEFMTPGTLVVVDGLFHQQMAVGHAELRTALRSGWAVWGLSSMGAIRAFEMSDLGMRGYGKVYDMFATPNVDFRDDEVTLLHGEAPDYAEFSEPLVHIRMAISGLVASGALTVPSAEAILGELEDLWFGDRTLPWVVERLRRELPAGAPEIAGLPREFDRYRIKSLDLIEFLRRFDAREGRLLPLQVDASP